MMTDEWFRKAREEEAKLEAWRRKRGTYSASHAWRVFIDYPGACFSNDFL